MEPKYSKLEIAIRILGPYEQTKLVVREIHDFLSTKNFKAIDVQMTKLNNVKVDLGELDDIQKLCKHFLEAEEDGNDAAIIESGRKLIDRIVLMIAGITEKDLKADLEAGRGP